MAMLDRLLSCCSHARTPPMISGVRTAAVWELITVTRKRVRLSFRSGVCRSRCQSFNKSFVMAKSILLDEFL